MGKHPRVPAAAGRAGGWRKVQTPFEGARAPLVQDVPLWELLGRDQGDRLSQTKLHQSSCTKPVLRLAALFQRHRFRPTPPALLGPQSEPKTFSQQLGGL